MGPIRNRIPSRKSREQGTGNRDQKGREQRNSRRRRTRERKSRDQGTRRPRDLRRSAPPLVLTHPKGPAAEKPGKAGAAQTAKDRAAAKDKAAETEESPFSVFVGRVYDGPLDLLLDLIRKQDIDIYDIPIAKITAQFLAYVNQLKASDVDVAGEFIYTASLLIHIKSKMLLPRAPHRSGRRGRRSAARAGGAAAGARALQERRADAAAEADAGGGHVDQSRRARVQGRCGRGAGDCRRHRRTWCASSATFWSARATGPSFNVEEDAVTVGQMIQFLARRLTMEDKPVALRRLLSHTKSERALVAMFLALLELVRLQAILLRQDRAFSEIFIKKTRGSTA